MRLHTFKATNCFGFRGTDSVDISYSRNLVCILGRNSAGKTALLTAIEALASAQKPESFARFENFDSTGEEPTLIGKFAEIQFADPKSPSSGGFGIARLLRDAADGLRQANAGDPIVVNSPVFETWSMPH